jgi:hypoxanthine phosphoribosyltransferase
VTQRIVTLISETDIAKRVKELGAQIAGEYKGKNLVLVCVLKGSFVFTADLARAIDLPLRIEFLGVRSYGEGTSTSGVVQITQDLTKPIEGEDILIVEDIVDTGLTIAHLLDLLRVRKPASVKVCALLHKPARTASRCPSTTWASPSRTSFVVGYGLDWGELLPQPAVHRRRGAQVRQTPAVPGEARRRRQSKDAFARYGLAWSMATWAAPTSRCKPSSSCGRWTRPTWPCT